MKKTQIIFYILLITVISLTFKLYLVDFSSPPITEDTYGYVLRAISISNGDYSESPRKTLGWSLFLSPFISLSNSNDFLSYLNIAQFLSIGVSLITIFAMYMLSRRFFDERRGDGRDPVGGRPGSIRGCATSPSPRRARI